MDIRLENFTKRFGPITVIQDMNLEIHDGEMLALLGPSGCGKSTTLFAVCGIHRIDGGRLYFGQDDVTDTPSQQRAVGVVFQSYALYPHMTVAENIGFPLRVRGDDTASRKRAIAEMAELVQITPYLKRRPAELSGGQQQRVALARALIRRPDVLLLDEPLANLDAKLRLEMRSEIRRIQRETGITAILVTHDQVEAMSMCDRIAIMEEGKIVQIAAPMDMYNEPASDFVAGFLGNPPISFLDGRIEQGAFVHQQSGLRIPSNGAADQANVRAGIRPEHVQANAGVPIEGEITFFEAHGRETLYELALAGGGALRSIQASTPDKQIGDRVNWGIDPNAVFLFSENGARL
ncbi:MAG: ABC transporter ATP-binding protein [Hyphomicrobiales bacterium]